MTSLDVFSMLAEAEVSAGNPVIDAAFDQAISEAQS